MQHLLQALKLMQLLMSYRIVGCSHEVQAFLTGEHSALAEIYSI